MLDHEIIGKFKEFQEKTGKYSDLKIEDVKFEIKRISSKNPNDLICEKRMGFTPKRDKNGAIYWFTVNDLNNNNDLIIDTPKTKEKTTIKLIKEAVDKNNTGKSEKLIPIQKGDVLVSFKLTVGVVKIYNSNVPAYCNEAIDILHIKKGYLNKYIAYNCMIEYPLYGTKTNNGITLNETDKEKIKIYIPKDLNEQYTSYKLQEAIVEFLEWGFAEADKIKENIDKIADILKRAKNCLIPSVFKKDYVKRTFGKYTKKNGLDYNITDVEFDIKRIISNDSNEVICKKRMGFTPKRINEGDINWFTVADLTNHINLIIDTVNTKEKTTEALIKKAIDKNNTGKSEKLKPIQKGDILVSFKLTVGVVKIYNSDEISYCNEAIDILTPYTNIVNTKYLAYNCMIEYPKYGIKTNNGITLNDDEKKKIMIFIPKPLKNYTSLEIQKHIADFIDHYMNIIAKEEDRVNKAYDAVERLKKVYLNRTFRLINWEKNNE